MALKMLYDYMARAEHLKLGAAIQSIVLQGLSHYSKIIQLWKRGIFLSEEVLSSPSLGL